jgi:uncharacterized protein (TIGR03067 family)
VIGLGGLPLREGDPMQPILCVLFVLAIPLLLAAVGGDAGVRVNDGAAVREELKALQGSWKAVALEARGAPLPAEAVPDFTFIIGPDGKSIGRMAQAEYTSRISVNPAADPRTMDNLHESGTHKGKTQYGVYKLDGDTFTVNMTAPGAAVKDRPKDFKTADTAAVLFVFKRVREEKKP